MRITLALFLVAVVSTAYSWNIPNLPSGKRTQFFVLHDDGGYKYGYDTGNNYFAKQAGDAQNQVAGHYVYKNVNGEDVDVKYTSGVQGFVPEGLEKLLPKTSGPQVPVQPYSYPVPSSYSSDFSSSSADDQANTGDASYNFNIDTDSYKRQESSDASGNVQGRYSYTNEAGTHDLSYIAGSNTGFVATSGSLSLPNGLEGKDASSVYSAASGRTYPSSGAYAPSSGEVNNVNTDGSYNFGFSTNDQSRQESSDAAGNVQGRYSFTNEAGTHDLSYVAGSQTGFLPTGGSLSVPNSMVGKSVPYTPQVGYPVGKSADFAPVVANPDGSYAFSYGTNDQSRQESSDASGNVQGRYSYTNEAGTHDLSYVAGSQTGFLPTGGSLAVANGLEGKSVPYTPQVGYPVAKSAGYPAGKSADYAPVVANPDGSYAFSYGTNDQSRQESSDASGNVQGRYSYTNEAGTHDLSYVAGSQTGFLPTGGSLAVANGLEGKSVPYTPQVGYPVAKSAGYPAGKSADYAPVVANPDGSYAFSYGTNDQSRQESSDASGNVQGRYSYTNEAGTHDLSYVAGSQTGFLPTGGSLAVANGLEGKSVPSVHSANVPSGQYVPSTYSSDSQDSTDDQANTGDASYSFNVDTPDYQRQESSDAQGNVKGSFSYMNAAGQHDLSFVAGSETGFLPTGGSLALPNGLVGKDVPATAYSANGYIPPVTSYSSASQDSAASQDDQANTGDSSYSFTVDTPEYQREESSDAQGNVKGVYSYKNVAGSHDLSYVAGSSTGFVATGGSLAVPNGVSGPSGVVPVVPTLPVAARSYVHPQARANFDHSAGFSEGKVGNVVLKTYLPSEGHSKYGYIFESA